MNWKTTAAIGLAAMYATVGHAALIGVAGPLSSDGTAAAIIGAPANALDDNVTNTGMQGFNEAQGVLTTVAHATDSGGIVGGTLVDSHMIFLNSQGSGSLSHFDVLWTFDGDIIGIMSDSGGTLEAASTFELGAPGTNYTVGAGAAPFAARGLESNNGGVGPYPNDGYTLMAPNVLRVGMSVTEPGDWIRVVTLARVPEPGSLGLLGAGLLALGLMKRRKV